MSSSGWESVAQAMVSAAAVNPSGFDSIARATAVSSVMNIAVAQSIAQIVTNSAEYAMQVANAGREDQLHDIRKEQDMVTTRVGERFQNLARYVHEHYAEHRMLRYNFNGDLEKVMVGALARLLETTKHVIADTPARWQAHDEKINNLVGGVKEGFESATKLVEKDLENIATHSQDAADAEQQITAFVKILEERRTDLDNKINVTTIEMNGVGDEARFLQDHLEPSTVDVTVWYVFVPITEHRPNPRYFEQVDDINRLRYKAESLHRTVDIYETNNHATMKFMEETRRMLIHVCEDENKLIDLKSDVQETFLDVCYIENYIKSPRVNFGRVDFIRCVLTMLRSDHMAKIEKQVGGELSQKKDHIIAACQSGLSAKDWEAAQQPYKRIDDDDIAPFNSRSWRNSDGIRPSPMMSLAQRIAVAA